VKNLYLKDAKTQDLHLLSLVKEASSVETSASESSTPTSGADSSNRSNIPSTGDLPSCISVIGIMAGIGGLALLAFRMRLKKSEE